MEKNSPSPSIHLEGPFFSNEHSWCLPRFRKLTKNSQTLQLISLCVCFWQRDILKKPHKMFFSVTINASWTQRALYAAKLNQFTFVEMEIRKVCLSLKNNSFNFVFVVLFPIVLLKSAIVRAFQDRNLKESVTCTGLFSCLVCNHQKKGITPFRSGCPLNSTTF